MTFENRNSRELGFGVRYPSRDRQLELCRYGFIAFYILVGALLSGILINVSPNPNVWIGNIVVDVILCVIFYFYCQNVHIQEVLLPLSTINMLIYCIVGVTCAAQLLCPSQMVSGLSC